MEHTTSVTPLALALTIVMGFLLLLLQRKYAPIPLIIVACYVTLDQKIYVALMGFTMLRIMLIFGFVRVLIKNEYRDIGTSTLDKLVVGWIISSVFFYTILYGNYQAFNYKMGHAYDAIGVYFLTRCLIIDFEDIIDLYKSISLLILPLAALMIIESITNRNMFSIFGGVPLIGEVRGGYVRCQGSFSHPILAGTFGATLMPVFVGLWFQKDSGQRYAILGFIAATVITVSSHSSGPLMAYLIGIIGMLMWRFRFRMRMVRWGIAVFLLLAHLFMKAPVWFLIARLSDLTGGGGWHRSELIDQTVHRFSEWWLYGTKYTAHWMVAPNPTNPDMIDITNWFAGQAINGGIVTLILFISIIVICYKIIGTNELYLDGQDISNKILIWSIGVSVTAHVTSFISVSYFDQLVFFWYFLVATISLLQNKYPSCQTSYVHIYELPI
jgi:hypothetical protein